METADTSTVAGRNRFTFDRVFQPVESTAAVYTTVAQPLVQAFCQEQQHGTIFAYGPTGSGKTFTMQGEAATSHTNASTKSSSSNLGIVQLAAAEVLQYLQQQDGVKHCHLEVQFFEIYNEKVRDLLSTNKNNKQEVRVTAGSSTKTGEPVVSVKSRSVRVSTLAQVESLLQQGNQNRACAATNINAQSSRSHAIFRMTLTSSSAPGAVLNLVDLAGSENSTKAGMRRKKETAKINTSLLALSKVFASLSLPKHKRPLHIGYRDSKLTFLLQPYLNSTSRVAVLACMDPQQLEESRSTLKFAHQAKRIPVQLPKQQQPETPKSDLLVQALQQELAAVKESLQKLQQEGANAAATVNTAVDDTEKEDKATTIVSNVEDDDDDQTEHSSEVVVESEPVHHNHSTATPLDQVVVVQRDEDFALRSDSNSQTEHFELLEQAQERIKFLTEKLESTDDLVEALFQELRQVKEQKSELETVSCLLVKWLVVESICGGETSCLTVKARVPLYFNSTTPNYIAISKSCKGVKPCTTSKLIPSSNNASCSSRLWS